MGELEEHLGAYRESGATTEEGRFTLDPSRAFKLLANYQLREPSE